MKIFKAASFKKIIIVYTLLSLISEEVFTVVLICIGTVEFFTGFIHNKPDRFITRKKNGN